jgi:hypothetical protein
MTHEPARIVPWSRVPVRPGAPKVAARWQQPALLGVTVAGQGRSEEAEPFPNLDRKHMSRAWLCVYPYYSAYTKISPDKSGVRNNILLPRGEILPEMTDF